MSGDWTDYEWAVVRLVPRVHRSELENVGVVLHARTKSYLATRIEPDWQRIEILAPDLDRPLAQRHLDGFLSISRGQESAGPVALLPPSERFHWLTAPRSAVVQTSEVHPGRCRDLEAELDRLFEEQCGRPTRDPP